MNYAVETVINGTFSIHSEHGNDKNAAIMEWHAVCRNLRGASDVQEATVKVIDSQGDLVEGYKEFIKPETPTVE